MTQHEVIAFVEEMVGPLDGASRARMEAELRAGEEARRQEREIIPRLYASLTTPGVLERLRAEEQTEVVRVLLWAAHRWGLGRAEDQEQEEGDEP